MLMTTAIVALKPISINWFSEGFHNGKAAIFSVEDGQKKPPR